MEKIRILIIDNHINVRTLLAARLAREPDFVVIHQSVECEDVIGIVSAVCPEVVLVDPMCGDFSGMVMLKDLISSFPETEFIVLTAIVDTSLHLELEKLGVSKILTKGIKSSELICEIRTVIGRIQFRDGQASP